MARTPDIDVHQPITRWSPRRKAALLAAVNAGQITLVKARNIHGLSAEELQSWNRGFGRDGEAGLRVASLQDCR